MAEHTPTPWFVSGVRCRMNGGEWHSINRYDEALKRDENVACVGYDSRTGIGLPDAHFIVKAVNAHDDLVKALKQIEYASRKDSLTETERLQSVRMVVCDVLSRHHVGYPAPQEAK